MKKPLIIALILFGTKVLYSQSPETLNIRGYRAQHEHEIIDEFTSFLSVPNIASDTINIQKDAAFIMQMMKSAA